jgi:hypothetical protein
VTGTFLDQASFSGKWLELLKDINPKLSRTRARRPRRTTFRRAQDRTRIPIAPRLGTAV